MECAVCLEKYDSDDRLPKSLSCMHTFCNRCVDHLSSDSGVLCPTCRQHSQKQKIMTNFAIADILDRMCDSCSTEDRIEKCSHCNKIYCESCMESHGQQYHSHLCEEVDNFHEIIRSAVELSMSRTLIVDERKKIEAATEEVKDVFTNYRRQLDTLEQEAIKNIKNLKEENIKKHNDWVKQVDAAVGRAKAFLAESQSVVDSTYDKTISIKVMAKVREECENMTATLTDLQNNMPQMAQYSYQAPIKLSLADVGRVVIESSDIPPPLPPRYPEEPAASSIIKIERGVGQSSLRRPKVPPRRSLEPRKSLPECVKTNDESTGKNPKIKPRSMSLDVYDKINIICMTGQQGSGLEDFDKPCRVACSTDRIYVCDERNQRVKVYNTSLKMMLAFGTKGSDDQGFRNPAGVAVGPGDKVYLCDLGNHRVKVYTKTGALIRLFGSHGSGNAQFNSPQDIAVGDDGLVYVCDSKNYRVQVVKADGTYVRTIGSKGTGPGHFENIVIYVALTKDNRVIVNEHNKGLHVFTTSGIYRGQIPVSLPPNFGEVKLSGVTVDQRNNIIVANRVGNLMVLDPVGEFVCTISDKGTGSGQLSSPCGVAVTHDGAIVVCDIHLHRISLWSL